MRQHYPQRRFQMNTYLLCREDMFEGLRINWSQSAELIIFLASFNARAKKNYGGKASCWKARCSRAVR
jgi:hypothetical protein